MPSSPVQVDPSVQPGVRILYPWVRTPMPLQNQVWPKSTTWPSRCPRHPNQCSYLLVKPLTPDIIQQSMAHSYLELGKLKEWFMLILCVNFNSRAACWRYTLALVKSITITWAYARMTGNHFLSSKYCKVNLIQIFNMVFKNKTSSVDELTTFYFCHIAKRDANRMKTAF